MNMATRKQSAAQQQAQSVASKAWIAFWLARDDGKNEHMRDAITNYRNAGATVNGHSWEVLAEALSETEYQRCIKQFP
jgi:hypothetical protein